MRKTFSLFQEEYRLLNKICENIRHDFGLTDAILSVFAVGENRDGSHKCEEIYLNILTDDPEKVDLEEYFGLTKILVSALSKSNTPEDKDDNMIVEIESGMKYAARAPRILCFLETVQGNNALCIDVCMYGKNNKKGFMNLATAVSEALPRFRGGAYVSTMFSLGEGVRREPPITTNIVVGGVDRWIEDDEEFQFWRKISGPYIRGYFEKPNFGNMGKDIIVTSFNTIEKCAKEQGDKGNFKIVIVPYNEMMTEAFCDISQSNWMETEIAGRLNSEEQMHFGFGERVKLSFELTDIRNNDEIGHLLDLSITLENDTNICSDIYRLEIGKVLVKFMEVWREVKGLNGYGCKVSEERSNF